MRTLLFLAIIFVSQQPACCQNGQSKEDSVYDVKSNLAEYILTCQSLTFSILGALDDGNTEKAKALIDEGRTFNHRATIELGKLPAADTALLSKDLEGNLSDVLDEFSLFFNRAALDPKFYMGTKGHLQGLIAAEMRDAKIRNIIVPDLICGESH